MRFILSIACCLLIVLYSQAQISFTEQAISLGVIHSSSTSGPNGMMSGSSVSLVDFNGDGLDDITLGVGLGDTTHFYINTGTGFQKIAAPVVNLQNTRQLLWVDYDNDGDKDLFIAHLYQPNRLYRNNGNLNFTDVTVSAGLPLNNDPTWSVAWGDYDRDGFVDLVVTNYLFGSSSAASLYSDYLFRNKGDGTFENKTVAANIPDYDHAAFAVVFTDYNNDLWPDIFIGSDKSPVNRMYRNNSYGRFDDVSAASGVNQVICSMGIAVGDYNNDGHFDYYVTGGPPDGAVLLHNNGNATFNNHTSSSGTLFSELAWGANFADFDNDRDEDLYVTGSNAVSGPRSSALFENINLSNFNRLNSPGIGMATDTAYSNAQAIGDLNNDGYVDIVVNNRSPFNTHLWMNNGGSNHWFKLRLEGTASNRDAIGARAEVYSNGTRLSRSIHCGISFMAQNSNTLLFGLGNATLIDSLKIIWPSGHIDTRYNLNCNQTLYVFEGSTAAVIPQIFSSQNPITCSGGVGVELYTNGQYSQYLWSTGATTAKIVVHQPGIYRVTTTDVLSRVNSSDTFRVNSFTSTPVLSLTADSLSCFGDATATAMASASGGVPPLIYSWSTGASGGNIQNLAGGNYWVLVRDYWGCSDSLAFQIIEPSALVNNVEVNLDSSGLTSTATTQVTGGTSPYSFVWNDVNGQTSSVATGLLPGTYTVYVRDAKNCWRIDTIEIQAPTGLENIKDRKKLKVYPNPSTGQSYLVSDDPNYKINRIRIFNLLGQEFPISFVKLERAYQLNFEGLRAGFYWLWVDGELYKIVIKAE